MLNNFEKVQEDADVSLEVKNLSEQSFYEWFRICVCKQNYIVKVFPGKRVAQYQKELQILDLLNHPNIVKPLSSHSQLVGQLAIKLKSQVLVFPERPRGNLMKYIERFGVLSQQVAKFYLKKIIRALDYTLETAGISHPNLTMENILMKDNRDIELCGWSNSIQANSKRQVSFILAQLAIELVTGRDPFPNKDIKCSPFAKFLKTDSIHKFWQQIEKSTKNRLRKFTFSENFKHFVGLMLLNQMSTFEEIQSLFLSQSQMRLENVQVQLQNREKLVGNSRPRQLNRV